MRLATKASKAPCNCQAQKLAKHIKPALTLRTTPSPARTCRTHKVPYTAACSHFTRKNGRPHASCGHYNAFCSQGFRSTMPLLSAEIRKTHRTSTYAANYAGPARTRRTHKVPFIAACSHRTRKNRRFRAPASSPIQAPCNIHATIPMRSETRDSTTAKNYTHRKTPKVQNTKENQKHQNERARNRLEPPFIAACSHFTRKNAGFVPRLPPQHKPHATSMRPLQCVLQHHMANPHISLLQPQVSHHPSSGKNHQM